MPEEAPSHDSRAESFRELGQLHLRSGREHDTDVIALVGELDLANAADVEAELLRVEATDAHAIVLDLSGLTFMDSTGIRMLVVSYSRARADSNRLTIIRPTGHRAARS